jgi:site-specific recombinase XerD
MPTMGSEALPGGISTGFPQDPGPAAAPPRLDPELESVLGEFVASRRAPGTRQKYEEYLRDFLAWAGIRTLEELKVVESAQGVSYRNSLQERGLSNATVNGRLAALRGLFGKLLVERRITGNPLDAALVQGLRVSDVSRTEGLSVQEVEAILATCDGTLRGLRDRALLLTLFYEGLRRSEASKLRFRDLTSRRGLLEVKGAKTSPYDTIRLRPEVERAVLDYLEVLNRDLERRETRPDDPVFVSLSRLRSFGKRLSPTSINEIVKARAKAAGITRRITAHSWRHTCTTVALQAGTPLHQVQRHLRHKNVQTTLRYDRERDVRRNPTTDVMPGVG